jgi:hypothetical protein
VGRAAAGGNYDLADERQNSRIGVIPSGAAKRRSRGIAIIAVEGASLSTNTIKIPHAPTYGGHPASLARNDNLLGMTGRLCIHASLRRGLGERRSRG